MKATMLILLLLGAIQVSAEPTGRYDRLYFQYVNLCNSDATCNELSAKLANLYVERVQVRDSLNAARDTVEELEKRLKRIERAVANCHIQGRYMSETPVSRRHDIVDKQAVEACRQRVIAETRNEQIALSAGKDNAELSRDIMKRRLDNIESQIAEVAALKNQRLNELKRQ